MTEPADETDMTLAELKEAWERGTPVTLVTDKEAHRTMNNALGIVLPTDTTLIGIAACSEASPQCTAVARKPNGDLVLANHVGAQFLIPAGEVMATAALMLKTTETQP
jgi:hypothetical protein